MGPRPTDFDEALIRQSPTFVKWLTLPEGEKLRYACREFVKGQGEDEERLMRRIMIARRNNVKDHQTLKRARHMMANASTSTTTTTTTITLPRSTTTTAMDAATATAAAVAAVSTTNDPSAFGSEDSENKEQSSPTSGTSLSSPPMTKALKTESSGSRKRRPATIFTDAEIVKEMDVAAVEATRSFRRWKSLQDGEIMTYNQSYVKGQPKHEWQLRKNIWRRMRYRRENKKIVEKLKIEDEGGTIEEGGDGGGGTTTTTSVETATPSPVKSRSTRASVAATSAAVAAAAAAAAAAAVVVVNSSVVLNDTGVVVHNPLVDAVADSAALDAAARLADAGSTVDEAAVAAAAAAAVSDAAAATVVDTAAVEAATAATVVKHEGTAEV